jgi:peroxiredoxin
MKYLLLLFSLLLTGSLTKGQSKTTPKTRTIIEGYFDDERFDTVRMTFYEQRLGNTSAGGQSQICITRKGHFSFTVPMEGNISYITLISVQKPALWLYEYLIKKGDSNYIHINTTANKGESRYTNGLTFSGKNCGSFQAKYHTDSAYMDVVKRVKHTTWSLDSINNNIRILLDQYFPDLDRSVEEYLLSELKKFKNETDEDIYEILSSDYRYHSEFGKLIQFRLYWGMSFRHPDSLARRKIMADYFKNTIQQQDSIFPLRAKTISKYYMDFECLKAEIQASVSENKQSINSALPFIPIVNQASQPVREKLLTSLIASLGSSKDLEKRDSIILYAMHTIKDNFLLNVVTSFYERDIKGRDAFVFTLQDVKGKPVTLSSFRGKTVVLDFWFTGCTGCVQVGKGLKAVKDHFENDSSVVFISISTDKERKIWLDGLQSGLYTDDRAINVYTMGKGQEHEIAKFYHINSYPRLMIIDRKGKLFAFNAERPGNPVGNSALTAQIRSVSQ